jgi:hypothetical protein
MKTRKYLQHLEQNEIGFLTFYAATGKTGVGY